MMPSRAQNLPCRNSLTPRSALIVIIVLLLRTRSFGVRPVEASVQPR